MFNCDTAAFPANVLIYYYKNYIYIIHVGPLMQITILKHRL